MEQVIVQWLIQQGPVTMLAVLWALREARRSDRLEQELERCHDRAETSSKNLQDGS